MIVSNVNLDLAHELPLALGIGPVKPEVMCVWDSCDVCVWDSCDVCVWDSCDVCVGQL